MNFTACELEDMDDAFAHRLREAEFIAKNRRPVEPNVHPVFAQVLSDFHSAPQTIAAAQAIEGTTK